MARRLAKAALMILAIATAAGAKAGSSQGDEGDAAWIAEKCIRYERAWREVQSRWGTDGVSAAFIDGNEGFIAGGCTAPARICPRTPRELEQADALTIAAMNAGMASTFLPFACRD